MNEDEVAVDRLARAFAEIGDEDGPGEVVENLDGTWSVRCVAHPQCVLGNDQYVLMAKRALLAARMTGSIRNRQTMIDFDRGTIDVG